MVAHPASSSSPSLPPVTLVMWHCLARPGGFSWLPSLKVTWGSHRDHVWPVRQADGRVWSETGFCMVPCSPSWEDLSEKEMSLLCSPPYIQPSLSTLKFLHKLYVVCQSAPVSVTLMRLKFGSLLTTLARAFPYTYRSCLLGRPHIE